MKIKTKLVVGSLVSLSLLVVLAVLARNDMNRVVDKLRFVEVQDDLNAGFLEMRLSEKNLFLFHDQAALGEIAAKIDESWDELAKSRERIVRGAGEANYQALRRHLADYAAAVETARKTQDPGPDVEEAMREAGRAMREFSTSLVAREREQVGEIIAISRRTMSVSLVAVVCTAVLAAPLLFRKVLRSLAQVERLAGAIAEGKFESIAVARHSHDELDSAITALNTMSERLSSREAEILQSKKLASLGTLTAGVAHEITNPVNNISMIAETYEAAHEDLSQGERLDMMRQIQKECERIHAIVTSLLEFSKPKTASMRPVSVNALVGDTLPLVRNMLHVSNIDLDLDLAEEPPQVMADASQMHQVLVNCITNAIQAMGPGGHLSVATGVEDGLARISIADSGKGIAPEVLPHIFDPFFSTKGTEGTGLGLSVSYGIVKNHNGQLRVESGLGQGTTCVIELPAVPPTEESHASATAENHGH